MQVRELGADRRREGERVGARPDQDLRHARVELRIGLEDVRGRLIRQADGPGVRHDAGDGHRLTPGAANRHLELRAIEDPRVGLAGEEAPREGPVDDDDRRRVHAIARGEVAPRFEAQAQRGEVAGADGVAEDPRRLLLGIVAADETEAGADPRRRRRFERQAIPHGDRPDARQGADAFEDPVDEHGLPEHLVQVRHRPERQQVPAIEARVGRGQAGSGSSGAGRRS